MEVNEYHHEKNKQHVEQWENETSEDE